MPKKMNVSDRSAGLKKCFSKDRCAPLWACEAHSSSGVRLRRLAVRMSGLDDKVTLEAFDGHGPSAYRTWKGRAQLMLAALPNTIPN